MSNDGHRQRILERYESSGLAAFQGYEILELFLGLLIPRKDVKPIAKEMLKKYKTISAVLNAPSRELEEIDGLGKRSVLLLKFVKDMQGYCLKEQIIKRDIKIASKNDIAEYLAEYLSFNFGNLAEECMILILLDAKNSIISAEIIAQGTATACPIQPQILFDRAMKAKASGIIIAHNHPSKCTQPSNADWTLTKKIASAGQTLEIPLIDHIIVSGKEILSLREIAQKSNIKIW